MFARYELVSNHRSAASFGLHGRLPGDTASKRVSSYHRKFEGSMPGESGAEYGGNDQNYGAAIRAHEAQAAQRRAADFNGGDTDLCFWIFDNAVVKYIVIAFAIVIAIGALVKIVVEFHISCDLWGKLFGLCGVLWLVWMIVAILAMLLILCSCQRRAPVILSPSQVEAAVGEVPFR